ncbi:MAG: hypothetical protein BGO97_07905 [Micrococcales bacterium 70-64]|nr:MAG: hypothetical protein ABT06_07910 [Leifsonia sp. SCN 70-46]OJX85651.1 MAG: hypothetical protein BGO97_07905 [Micrococcales bacterium 70-64]
MDWPVLRMLEQPVDELVILVAQRPAESPAADSGQFVEPRGASAEARDPLLLRFSAEARRGHRQSKRRIYEAAKVLVAPLGEGVGRSPGSTACSTVGLVVVLATGPLPSFAVGKEQLVVVGLVLDEAPKVRVISGQPFPELACCLLVSSDVVFGAFGSRMDDGHGLSPGDRFFGLFRQE